MKLLILEEVAEIMHWKIGTARNRMSKKNPMPPHVIKGQRILFPEEEFIAWVKKDLITGENNNNKHVGNKRLKNRVISRNYK